MAQVVKSRRALKDLDDLWDYIAEDNPRRASSFLRMIDDKLWMLAENPMLGRSREELAPNLRSFPAGNYLIFYVPLEDGIEVARVLSGARDLPSAFRHPSSSPAPPRSRPVRS